ncbi:MAG: diadenylate cyclase [Nitrospirota bacterium]
MPERMLAGVFSDDGAVFIKVPTGEVTIKGLMLTPSENSYGKAKNHELISARGTRHKSAFAYSIDNPNAMVFILSQDGGCLMAFNNVIYQIW